VARNLGEVVDQPTDTDSRVTPLVPEPQWPRDGMDSERPMDPLAVAPSDAAEHSFWDTPPRYSVTNSPSLAPSPPPPISSPWRIFAARALFAMIFCAAVVLLALEIRALVGQDGASLVDERVFAALAK
jgi:hypothetical protein